jgi:hypothetical protein
VGNAAVTEFEKVIDDLNSTTAKVGVNPADVITNRTGGEDDPWRRQAIGRWQQRTDASPVDQERAVHPSLSAAECR